MRVFILLGLALSWCQPVTDAHHETALYYGGAVEGAQAMDCMPFLTVLRCDVYHPYGEAIEMWCSDQTCEYVIP
ncbi:hypothetical protein LCGC14_1322630 [marine sediment metagenome]|uniref:Uncharacterized protein n=1 Tax=marine sediment metagenome TaxID=412755 RepID=A0A0F9MZT9_9ZZZZ